MKILVPLIFLLIFNPTSFAQNQNRNFSIQTNLLQNFDISHPRINLDFEKEIKSAISISGGIGIYYSNFFFDQKTAGLGFNFEIKKFKNERFFYAFGINGAKIKYNPLGEFWLGNPDTATMTYTENYRIEKIISDLYFKIGFRKSIGKIFYFDTFCGLGLRYKDTRHLDRSRPEDQFYRRTLTLLDYRDKKGIFFLPVLKVGLILGLKI
jgi:hypothetical protein